MDDDLLNWPFHNVRKSQNWLPAREIATEIRLDDHAESLDESLENAHFPLFFRRYWTYRSVRRHKIEKGRRKGGSRKNDREIDKKRKSCLQKER